MAAHIASKNIFESLQLLRILRAYRFGKISKDIRIIHINFLRAIIFQNPRKDVVLIQIVMSPTTIFVQQHDIVEIGKTSFYPLLSVVQLRKLFMWLFDYF